MPEHSLHALELLRIGVKQLILDLVMLGSPYMILLTNYLIIKSPIIFEITNLRQVGGARANPAQI